MENLNQLVSKVLKPYEYCGPTMNVIKDLKYIWVALNGWLSFLWWGSDLNEVSPVSGLTIREVYAIQKSWVPVNANMVANGTELLRRFFTVYPDTTNFFFFKMVKNLPADQYIENPQFQAHVVSLMGAINQAVNNMDQPEVVVAMMHQLGRSHGRRKIKEAHFLDLKGVVVKMFIEVMKFDNETLDAWSKTVDFWFKHIFETLESN